MSYKLKDINKYSSIWSPHIRSYCLPNLIKKMQQCLWKGIDRHPHSHSVAFATSPAHHLKSPVSKGIKTARLPSAYLVVNNRVLKMQNIRTRQAHIGAFLQLFHGLKQSAVQVLPGAEIPLYSTALRGIFPPCFSSYYLNSQLCVVRNSILFSTHSVTLLDFLTTSELTLSELYRHFGLQWRLSVQSSSYIELAQFSPGCLTLHIPTSSFFWCWCLTRNSLKDLPQLGSCLFIQALYVALKSILPWINNFFFLNYSSLYPYHIWNILNSTNTAQISTGFYW